MMDNNQSIYRWYILFLSAMGNALIGLLAMCMPVLFKEISEDLGLSLVQIGTVWSMFNLAAIFTTLPGGSLVDRFGVKHTIGIACILAGLAGALRGISGGFFSLAATMFLVGFLAAAIIPCIHNAAAIWFPRHQLGRANGAIMMGMGVGQTMGAMFSATVLSPLLGGWRGVMFLYGGIAVVLGILWLISRSPTLQYESSGGSPAAVPLRQSLAKVARIKNLWFVGLSGAGMLGCYTGSIGYMALYLEGIGWSVDSASGVVAVTGVVAIIATIPISALSDRLGTRKKIMVVAAMFFTIAFGLFPLLSGPAIWIAVIIGAIPGTGYMALMVTIATETEEVGAHIGTAMGVVLTILRLGGIIAPPLGNSLASISPGAPFFLWAAMAAFSVICLYFVKDTGHHK
jgi:AAHS family cis,cis-muconate transporter-like MFS transporter